MKPDQIPAWCFLTGQFLIHFEANKTKDSYKEVHRNFLNSLITEPRLRDFDYQNPGFVLMFCYGLLVYPLEFWKKLSKGDGAGFSFQSVENQIISAASDRGLPTGSVFDLFEIIKPSSSLDIADLFRMLRNAVSHANVSVDMIQNRFTFCNVKKNGIKNFEATISTANLGIFLTGVVKFFFNVQRGST